MSESENEEIEFYGDEQIASFDKEIPGWLKLTYLVMPLWGIVWFCLYWNGSWGWLDPGYWKELQRAANTTFPHINQDSTLK
jgi:hypothetical protein